MNYHDVNTEPLKLILSKQAHFSSLPHCIIHVSRASNTQIPQKVQNFEFFIGTGTSRLSGSCVISASGRQCSSSQLELSAELHFGNRCAAETDNTQNTDGKNA